MGPVSNFYVGFRLDHYVSADEKFDEWVRGVFDVTFHRLSSEFYTLNLSGKIPNPTIKPIQTGIEGE